MATIFPKNVCKRYFTFFFTFFLPKIFKVLPVKHTCIHIMEATIYKQIMWYTPLFLLVRWFCSKRYIINYQSFGVDKCNKKWLTLPNSNSTTPQNKLQSFWPKKVNITCRSYRSFYKLFLNKSVPFQVNINIMVFLLQALTILRWSWKITSFYKNSFCISLMNSIFWVETKK